MATNASAVGKRFLEIDRRRFLRSAGAAFALGLSPRAAEAFDRSEPLFAAATLRKNRTFGAAVFGANGQVLHEIDLPARGHDVAVHSASGHCVVFARRPGTFAVAFNVDGRKEPLLFASPENRHFYGHGTFSADGRLLYAAENDFENAQGKIGIYDVIAGYRRTGEFNSYGTGPHEIALMPDGQTLLIANGGIETHPDYQRQKLNIATMEPSIAMLDVASGALKASFALPSAMHKISLRHMAVANNGRAYIGGQTQDKATSRHPVLWELSQDRGLSPLLTDPGTTAAIGGYVGSLKLSSDERSLAFTSPPTGKLITIDLVSGGRPKTAEITTQGALVWSEKALSPSPAGNLYLDNHCADFSR